MNRRTLFALATVALLPCATPGVAKHTSIYDEFLILYARIDAMREKRDFQGLKDRFTEDLVYIDSTSGAHLGRADILKEMSPKPKSVKSSTELLGCHGVADSWAVAEVRIKTTVVWDSGPKRGTSYSVAMAEDKLRYEGGKWRIYRSITKSVKVRTTPGGD